MNSTIMSLQEVSVQFLNESNNHILVQKKVHVLLYVDEKEKKKTYFIDLIKQKLAKSSM